MLNDVSNQLMLRSLLPYWVPMLMLPLLWRSMNSKLGNSSSAVISLPVTVAFSHAIFLLPLALVLTARYFFFTDDIV